MDIKFIGKNIAILEDLRHPYLSLGIHPEWRQQFRKAISSPKVHKTLDKKLHKIAPFILCYTKIKPDINDINKMVGFKNPTICIISSVGEHAITPWMIIHNIGHTYLSWHIEIKKKIIKLLGLDPVKYSIVAKQDQLVHCAASRNRKIPNMNELIYELFTTWVWHGTTKSDNKELAKFCNTQFENIIAKHKNHTIWHRFRSPTNSTTQNSDWITQFVG